MKTMHSLRLFSITLLLVLSYSGIKAQDPTPVAVDTTPVVAPVAAPAPAAPAAPEETKAKKEKDGFNSHNRFGVRVGGVISKQDFESSSVTEDPESKFGADLAIVYAIPVGSGFFMLQPELHWMQKGYKIEDAAVGGDVTSTLNYLELPVLARFNFGGSLKVFAFAGPSAGYLLSGTVENDNGEEDATDFLDELEFSGHIGVGVGLGTLELDVRYIAGLTDIADSPNLSEVKNSSFGVGLTLKF